MTSNHNICDRCYHAERKRLGLKHKEPIRLAPLFGKLFDSCCWCGSWNNGAIYIRTPQDAKLSCNHWEEVLG